MKRTPAANDLQVAVAICSAYGISPENFQDAAHEVCAAMRSAPAGRRSAAAHRTAQRILAKELGITQKALSSTPSRARAVGEYEKLRRRCRLSVETFSFDLHSQHFAIENGVCPRCATARNFTEAGGSCPCGFRFGLPGASEPEDTDALEKLLGDARQSA